MTVLSRLTVLLAAFLFSMTSSGNISAEAFAAAVPGTSGSLSASTASAAAEEVITAASEELPKTEDTTSEIPLLPASNTDDASIPRIQLGESISFDHMGPIIINSDGTTRAIENWNDMSPQEQQTAWRRIAKRNEERRAALLQKQQESKSDSVVKEATNEL